MVRQVRSAVIDAEVPAIARDVVRCRLRAVRMELHGREVALWLDRAPVGATCGHVVSRQEMLARAEGGDPQARRVGQPVDLVDVVTRLLEEPTAHGLCAAVPSGPAIPGKKLANAGCLS